MMDDIKAGQFVIEYVGEVISIDDVSERMANARHFYFLTIDSNEGIDASQKGNIARFINHSCDPNCQTQKWWVQGETCVGIFAMRDIPKGSELTFDYQFERLGVAKQRCLCGAAKCRGFLGAAPVKSELEEAKYIFSNHQRFLERLLKRLDIYTIDEAVVEARHEPPVLKNSVESEPPLFLKRNHRVVREYWLNQLHLYLNDMFHQREKSLASRNEQKRHKNAENYMMSLDIAALIRQGLIVFDKDEGGKATRSRKKGDGNEKKEIEAGEDKMDLEPEKKD